MTDLNVEKSISAKGPNWKRLAIAATIMSFLEAVFLGLLIAFLLHQQKQAFMDEIQMSVTKIVNDPTLADAKKDALNLRDNAIKIYKRPIDKY